MEETLAFSKDIGAVHNRVLFEQADINLTGIMYLQNVWDVTNIETGKGDNDRMAIHAEPGLWMRVPESTTNPVQAETINRMGCIPHGTTINSQGITPTKATPGPPDIPRANITPFDIGSDPPRFREFDNQKAHEIHTRRIPQDLGKFIETGTITQAILDDPNLVLRNANLGKKINHTTTIKISTSPAHPHVGGGTANIDFLMGSSTGEHVGPNAHGAKMEATFWISEVSHEITVPEYIAGSGEIFVKAPSPVPGKPDGFQAPTFKMEPPETIKEPKKITVTSTQIQYSQNVLLDFARLSWPHVSVATLIPAESVDVPQSAFR